MNYRQALAPPTEGDGSTSLASIGIVINQKRFNLRIADILKMIGSEVVETGKWTGYEKLEAALREQFDAAVEGNLFALEFIAQRMEGKPTQMREPPRDSDDPADMPTHELMEIVRRSSDDEIAALVESRVRAEVEKRLASIEREARKVVDSVARDGDPQK